MSESLDPITAEEAAHEGAATSENTEQQITPDAPAMTSAAPGKAQNVTRIAGYAAAAATLMAAIAGMSHASRTGEKKESQPHAKAAVSHKPETPVEVKKSDQLL